MRTVQPGPVIGLFGQFVLLLALAATVGLSSLGLIVGLGCGLATFVLLSRAVAHRGGQVLGPADRVTLLRATLAGGVAGLAAGLGSQPVLVSLAVLALVLDAVDGQVARRTGTVSALGARFDMEVDAFLILVLSSYVAWTVAPGRLWVLAIGAARYAFVAAGWLLPALRASSPPRYWCKVVAAVQGIVLTFAAAGVLPGPVIGTALAIALALLAESFGRDVWWLLRHAPARPRPAGAPEFSLVRPSPSLVCNVAASRTAGGA